MVITSNLDTPRIEEIQEINPFSQENMVQKTILLLRPSLWNSLPELKKKRNLNTFKHIVKKYCLS